MGALTLPAFLKQTGQAPEGTDPFELVADRLLRIAVNGMVWTKMGSMVAYRGNLKFTREGILEQGFGQFLKKAVSGEGTRLTKAEGSGMLFLADEGKKVTVLSLQGESIFVNGNDVLAFESGIKSEVKMLRKVAGMLSGGLFNVRLEGKGRVAITTHHDPLTLIVKPGQPVVTDPNATVAWSGSLNPEIKTDVSFKTFLWRGSGESIQTLFQGDGFVIIQPYEEVYFQAGGGS